jgi:hypothetical protein
MSLVRLAVPNKKKIDLIAFYVVSLKHGETLPLSHASTLVPRRSSIEIDVVCDL